MQVTFNNIKITGFLSIGEAEVDLTREGYILISGVNRNPLDHALSNGSGKSSLLNAICWTLTGETINGLSKGIPNINTDTGCKCELDLTVDGKDYLITRYKDYNEGKVGKRTDLKITIDGADVSGKGIKESEIELAKYLPDLTSEFLGSVILLGQGLPHKFTDNTPAKRKELLETLSKSDFMLNDIRNRLTTRMNEVLADDRHYADEKIRITTEINVLNRRINDNNAKLNQLDQHEDWDAIISQATDKINTLSDLIKNNKEYRVSLMEQKDMDNKSLLEVSQREYDDKRDLDNTYNSVKTALSREEANLSFELKSKLDEIKRIASLPDICPTCGQKMPADKKPDTSDLQARVNELTPHIEAKKEELNRTTTKRNEDYQAITDKYKAEKDRLTLNVNNAKNLIYKVEATISADEREVSTLQQKVTKAQSDKANYNSVRESLLSTIAYDTAEVDTLKKKEIENNRNIDAVTLHLNALKKMDTALKRDFRGVLLSNVIKFIDMKAKEYSKLVFKTDKLNVVLNGNAIDIDYCSKAYENLSGGEKQKVDIIIQFAIRDMLCKYLNFSSNILAFDELFDNLDELGTREVLDLIAKKLTDVESVYIISHHGAELQVPYDYEITVEKDENGVSTIR